ncbi:MAG: hypothetical protein K6E85_10015 [Lachnospiraceae bacterium]|nr:hypothetical protein [Lachnospiraceae bacterium]
MGKRGRFEIGRFAAALLAVILIAIIPVRSLVSHRTDEINSGIASYLDEFTSQARQKGCISLSDYENMLSYFDDLGFRFSINLSIEREAESMAGSIRYVSGHVHSPSCYAGHNHKASGCRFHKHSSECVCNGTFSTYSWFDPETVLCTTCYGRGKTGYIGVCPECHGEEPDWEEVTCPRCDGKGEAYQDIWYVCPTCNGAGCDICDEGRPGGWYKNELSTCKTCHGSGTVLEKLPCSICGGKGTVGEVVTCSECGGSGLVSGGRTHYMCNVCGEGDSTAFGTSCGRYVCGMDFESYECGIVNEDLTPRCNMIIVDAAYQNSCTIRQFDTADMVDASIMFTYLNGTSRTYRTRLVSGPDEFDSSQPGVLNMKLSYTGYYEEADNYETRSFPIQIKVLPVMAKCGKCGRSYYLDKNGQDPGCPYCIGEEFSLRVVVNGDVVLNKEPDIDVYAVGESDEKKLDKTEYELFYDDETIGEQTAAIYCKGIWEYFVIRVVPDSSLEPGVSEIPRPSGSPTITMAPEVSIMPGIPVAPEMTPIPEITLPPQGSTLTPFENDGAQIDPEKIEDYDSLISGKYIHVPNDDIVASIYTSGSCNLLAGDMLNVTVDIFGGNALSAMIRRFFIPNGIQEKYSSGIMI